MKKRTKEELRIEIRRVNDALNKTTSRHLKEEYGRYLRKLCKEIVNYERG